MKVMTFNIWNYTPPWPQRRELIVDLIRREEPDVIALQETRHDWRFERGKGQGEQLAQRTGYHATWAVGQVYAPILRVDEGLTILSRWPPLNVAERQLSQHPRERADENQRICLAGVFDIEGKSVTVFNTHFSLSSHARISNSREVSGFVSEVCGSDPALLLGDLNALPDTPPIDLLLNGHPGEAGARFIDCWAVAKPDLPGFTYSSWSPIHRIDYVLASGISPQAIKSARIIGEQSLDGVYPSDHLGVVVEIAP